MNSETQAQPNFYIYKITNLKNKKIYIGKTSGSNPHLRFYNHKKRAFYKSTKNECPKLYRSIRKYGAENFSFEIILKLNDENEAYDAEEKLIKEFNSMKNGMNTSIGGNRSMCGELNPMYGKGYLISGNRNGMYGKNGKLNPFHGQKHSEEFINYIKNKNRVLSNEDVITIKEMIFQKINYEIIAEKFNISIVTIHRIKTGVRYADIGKQYNFHKYNKNISDEEVEHILRLWLKNPIIKNNQKQIKEFYDAEVKDKYNLSRKALGFIIRGERWRHIYNKLISPS